MAELILYFSLTYAATWASWFVARQMAGGAPQGVVFLIGVFMPGLVALALTRRREGRSGVLVLLRRLVDWNVPVRWYVFAFSYVAVIKLSAALIYRATTGGWPGFGEESLFLMFAATVSSTLLGGQVGEELGWRGFALPRLAARLGLGGASVVLGLLWAGWHLPLFYASGADTFGQSFPLYVLQVTALSVAMAWLYWKTEGSLLLVMLLHAAGNNTKDIVPSVEPGATNVWALSHSLIAWLTVALLWTCATFFLVQMRGASIPGRPKAP